MAYGVIIRASLATAEGTHMIEVLRRDYSGAIHEVHAGTPFYVEEYGTRGADLDADIRPSQVTVNLIITDAAALGAVRGTLSAESREDRKSTRLNSSHVAISYAVFCLKKKKANSLQRTYRRKRNATHQTQQQSE